MDCVAGALVFQQAFKQQCHWLQRLKNGFGIYESNLNRVKMWNTSP